MFKKIADALTSWVALVVMALFMIGISWGLAGGWISIFWGIVLAAVLIGELGNKLFSPDKKTLTTNVRKEVKLGNWRIWVMLIAWLVFSVQLFLHFIKPLILGG
jgi:hypothetical protein